jgi:hypothetical protein
VAVVGLLDYSSMTSASPKETNTQLSLRILNEMENLRRSQFDALVSKIFLFNFPFSAEGEDEGRLNMRIFSADILEVFPPSSSSSSAAANQQERHTSTISTGDIIISGFPSSSSPLEFSSSPSSDLLRAHASEVLASLAVQLILRCEDQARYFQDSCQGHLGHSGHPSSLSSTLALGFLKSSVVAPPKGGHAHDKTLSSFQAEPSQLERALAYHIDDGSSKMPKSVRLGRVQKYIGDLCLQVGSPLDAVRCYLEALSLLRPLAQSGDETIVPWVGWALEGVASSLVLAYHYGVPDDDVRGVFVKDKEERDRKRSPLKATAESTSGPDESTALLDFAERMIEEALQLYVRRPQLLDLRIDAFLKLAALIALKCGKADKESDLLSFSLRTRVSLTQNYCNIVVVIVVCVCV